MDSGAIQRIEKILNYSFNNYDYLQIALTHSSFNSYLKKNNERMEFLGDKILGFIIAEYVYCNFVNKAESFLSRIIAYLGSKEVLAEIAIKLKLQEFIRSNTEEINDRILSSTIESLIAAIYLDANDINIVKKSVLFLLRDHINCYSEDGTYLHFNPKSYVQEWAQKNSLDIPKYKVLNIQGEDHNPVFCVEISVDNKKAEGIGNNKKMAQKDAANSFITKYKI